MHPRYMFNSLSVHDSAISLIDFPDLWAEHFSLQCMRCSARIVDGQLTFDNLYRTACAPLDLLSILARFGNLSSKINVVS